jgi:multidrug efflux pump
LVFVRAGAEAGTNYDHKKCCDLDWAIEAEQAAGKDVRQAAIDASSARFRPIMLTAISTVLGMIPIAPTVFWGPMAFAIMGGLLVGTMLTLVFYPRSM